MHLAIKISHVSCWNFKTLYETIGKNKFSYNQLISMENEILKYTDYSLLCSNLHDFVMFLKEMIFYNKENNFNIRDPRLQKNIDYSLIEFQNAFNDIKANFDEKFFDNFGSILNFISKFITFDYILIGKYPSLLAVSAIIVSLIMCEKIFRTDFKVSLIIEKLCDCISVDEKEMNNICCRIFYLIENLENSYLMEFPTFKEDYEEVQMLII